MLFVQGMLVGAYNIFLEEITNRDYLWGDGLGVMGRRILRVGWELITMLFLNLKGSGLKVN